MGHAAAEELHSRGYRVLLLSRNPVQTRELFGFPAAATLPFPWSAVDREDYLRRIRAHLAGSHPLPAGDPALDLIRVLGECDGVVVAGGGNLNSRYGWLLYERAAVVAVATAAGKPVVISGQTLGPQLSGADAIVLADMLAAAELCLVREPASLALARGLGIAAVAGLDDASFWGPDAGGAEGAPKPPEAAVHRDPADAGYVAVTVAPFSGAPEDFYALIGAQLDNLHAQTGLPSVFVPHMGIGSEEGWDSDAHARIASSMTTPSRQLSVLTAREVAAQTAGASLVVTSRYHPAVFALSAGVPVTALAVDTYSGVRLAGAMGNWGLEDYVVALPAALTEGLLAPALTETWQRRAGISAHLEAARPSRAAAAKSWWDAVAAVFAADADRSSQIPVVEDLPAAPRFPAAGAWADQARTTAVAFYARSRREAQAEVEEDRLHSYLGRQAGETEALRAEHRRLVSSRTVKAARSLHRVAAKVLRR